jgi:hypothetical protein
MKTSCNSSPYLHFFLVIEISSPADESSLVMSVTLLEIEVSKESCSVLAALGEDKLGHRSMSSPKEEVPSLVSTFEMLSSFLPSVSALAPGAFCSLDLMVLASSLDSFFLQ